MTVAAAQLAAFDSAEAHDIGGVTPAALRTGAPEPPANTSFAPLKQINAGLLNVGYAEAGPANGPP